MEKENLIIAGIVIFVAILAIVNYLAIKKLKFNQSEIFKVVQTKNKK